MYRQNEMNGNTDFFYNIVRAKTSLVYLQTSPFRFESVRNLTKQIPVTVLKLFIPYQSKSTGLFTTVLNRLHLQLSPIIFSVQSKVHFPIQTVRKKHCIIDSSHCAGFLLSDKKRRATIFVYFSGVWPLRRLKSWTIVRFLTAKLKIYKWISSVLEEAQ